MTKDLEEKLKECPALYREYLITKIDICLDLYREGQLDPQDLTKIILEFYKYLTGEKE